MKATEAVREILLRDGPEDVLGTCIQACLILGWHLLQQGIPAEMWSYSPHGWPHGCVRSGDWTLDPSAGQFGDHEDPLLLFPNSSPPPLYDPGEEEHFPICQEELIDSLAAWIEGDADPHLPEPVTGRSRAIPALLNLANLSHLAPAIRESADIRVRERAAAGWVRKRLPEPTEAELAEWNESE